MRPHRPIALTRLLNRCYSIRQIEVPSFNTIPAHNELGSFNERSLKRQRTAALQDAVAQDSAPELPRGFGVRLSSAAFVAVLWSRAVRFWSLDSSCALRIFLLLVCFAGARTVCAAPTVQFEKILPFARADEVRIECAFKSSDDLTAIDLTATIIQANGGQKIWQGTLGQVSLKAGLTNLFSKTISSLKPQLWSPNSPTLYTLIVSARKDSKILAEQNARFGFRSFESRDGNFYLNGHPIFLRGLAINPPGRTVPTEVGESRTFAEAYVRFLKSQNINTIRLTHDSQVWFDVCDELGMLVYQGQYGSPLGTEEGKQSAPTDFNRSVAAYENLFETYARHPSIVIYILSNELPVSGARGRAFHEFLTRAHAALKTWDPTRLFIGNAGYGEGREGDICDVHRYWGWYYNTFLTYYNLRDPKLFGDPAKNQPLTFSECVGSFTGPDGAFNLVVRKQLGAQLNWTGHSTNQREDALRYQSFIAKQAAESFRRLRPLNHRLSGLMPFTILFHNWSGITSFEQMKAKPAMSQLALAYQPVLLSWEMWTPQVYAGSVLHPTAHVINDAEDYRAIRNASLIYRLRASDGREIFKTELNLPEIGYYEAWSKHLDLQLPAELPTGDYVLSGEIVSAGRTISTNTTELFVAGKEWKESIGTPQIKRVALFDPSGHTATAFQKLQIPFTEIRDLKQRSEAARVIVIGENALSSATNSSPASLSDFVSAGGRVLCLQQEGKFDQSWLPESITFFIGSANAPTYPPASRPFRDNMNINPEWPNHPVFEGIERRRLELWSDYTDWDQTKPGFPQMYPVTSGFKLTKPESLARTAILADYDRGLEGIALCEMFSGKGSVILSAFDLVSRVGLDPIADRLLANLVRYAASTNNHEIHPLIDSPIRWGDYASERGLITGPANGLVLNATWIRPPTNPSAKPLSQDEGAWNVRPGDQFVPHGRSLLGPYGYSTSTSLRDLNPNSKTASGTFWARIPAGKNRVVTSIENPSPEPAEFSVTINENSRAQNAIVPPQKTMELVAPLPHGITNASVHYVGSKALVLLQTSFE
jgi:beta-galactosidase